MMVPVPIEPTVVSAMTGPVSGVQAPPTLSAEMASPPVAGVSTPAASTFPATAAKPIANQTAASRRLLGGSPRPQRKTPVKPTMGPTPLPHFAVFIAHLWIAQNILYSLKK